MKPQLCLIVPLGEMGGGTPEHPIAPVPPGIWPLPGYPSHPIAPGGTPPGIWPGPGQPSHPIELPPGSVGGTPEHPIYYPPPYPLRPSHPIVLPPGSISGTPEHPIYNPPHPDHSLPGAGSPPGIWPGPGYPTHPIAPGGGEGIWPSPGYPDQGLPVPPGQLPGLPEVPPELASQVVVAVHKPGQPWVVKTYPVGPEHPIAPGGTPPVAQPKK